MLQVIENLKNVERNKDGLQIHFFNGKFKYRYDF